MQVTGVELAGLETRDMEWLLVALRGDYHETSVENVLEDLVAGRLQVWRLGEFQGILLTKLINYSKGRELIVTHIAGKGFLNTMDKVDAAMERFARVHGCRWYSTLAVRKGLIPQYAKRAKAVGTLFLKEL